VLRFAQPSVSLLLAILGFASVAVSPFGSFGSKRSLNGQEEFDDVTEGEELAKN
jgi:hypothetical protein